jgi:hypothetical protein
MTARDPGGAGGGWFGSASTTRPQGGHDLARDLACDGAWAMEGGWCGETRGGKYGNAGHRRPARRVTNGGSVCLAVKTNVAKDETILIMQRGAGARASLLWTSRRRGRNSAGYAEFIERLIPPPLDPIERIAHRLESPIRALPRTSHSGSRASTAHPTRSRGAAGSLAELCRQIRDRRAARRHRRAHELRAGVSEASHILRPSRSAAEKVLNARVVTRAVCRRDPEERKWTEMSCNEMFLFPH